HFAATLEDLLDRGLVAGAALIEAPAAPSPTAVATPVPPASPSAAAEIVVVIIIVVVTTTKAVLLADEMLVVLVFHVANVEEPVATDAEVDEDRLDTGFDVDDPALVDVA